MFYSMAYSDHTIVLVFMLYFDFFFFLRGTCYIRRCKYEAYLVCLPMSDMVALVELASVL